MKKILLCMAVCMTMISGCAAPKKVEHGVVFYPEPPNLPRVQFLVSFTGEKDIQPPKSGFEAFVTGVKESPRRLDKPYGVAIHEGKIYVCDTNATVMVFDLNKRTYEPLKGAVGLGKLVQPINISVDRDGNKYVADSVRGQVIVFDKNDLYVKAFGRSGAWRPVDAVVFEGKLYVADAANREIKVFDKNSGVLERSFGAKGEIDAQLVRPINLVFDAEGYLYVTDAGRFQVVRFDRDGHFFGTIGKLGTNIGHFGRPRGVAADKENRIYVADASYNNVQIFSRDGQNLTFFGEAGTDPGKLTLPAKVVIDYENKKYFEKYVDPNFAMEHLVIVTSQFGDRLVNVFAFGKEKGKKYPSDEEFFEQLKERLQKQRKEQPQETEKPEEDK